MKVYQIGKKEESLGKEIVWEYQRYEDIGEAAKEAGNLMIKDIEEGKQVRGIAGKILKDLCEIDKKVEEGQYFIYETDLIQ